MQVSTDHLLSAGPLSLDSASLDIQSVVLGPAASMSLGPSLEKPSLRPHPEPAARILQMLR